jgi:hypothetical protein
MDKVSRFCCCKDDVRSTSASDKIMGVTSPVL